MEQELTARQAMQWMVRIATVDGEISPGALSVIAKFSNEFNVSISSALGPAYFSDTFDPAKDGTPGEGEAEAREDIKRRSMADLLKDERARVKRTIQRMISTRKQSDYNKDAIQIAMPDGSLICESSNIDTMEQFLDAIGFSDVNELGFHIGKYPLISKENTDDRYVKSSHGWYIFNKLYTYETVILINDIADALDVKVIARVVPK